MKTMKIIKIGNLALILVAFICTLLLPGTLLGGNIPSIEDVIKGKASMPTIEDLTDGKVKNDGQINKSNVELVKEYLPLGIYENVKRGMVLDMGTQQPPDQLNPKVYYEATERNLGKAVMDKNGVLYYEKIGTKWPGGLPYPWVKSGLEAMANNQYGKVWDSYHNNPVYVWYVNSKGEVYKTVGQEHFFVKCNGRTIFPPLGVFPGFEDIIIRKVSGGIYPLEIKGLGQYTNRYYDYVSKEDTGFVYLPAFKRTLRANASTWQDNLAGSDLTYGDGDSGIQEAPSTWNIKLLGKKFILVTEAKSPFPMIEKDGSISNNIKYDVGKKYPRVRYVVCPVDVVEATPKIKHVYGKKVLYMPIYPYVNSVGAILAMDIYDRQLKLWKEYIQIRGRIQYINGDPQKAMTAIYGLSMYDLQADHTTHMWVNFKFEYLNPQDLNLGKLIKLGR